MNLVRFIWLWLLAASSFALDLNYFKAKSSPIVAASRGRISDDIEIIPMDLLDPISRKPEIFTQALQELSELKAEPICTRLATQVHIQACQRLDGSLDKMERLLNREHEIEHQVKSFAASLTMCAMEAGGVDLSGPCVPFTSASLRAAYEEGDRKLLVSAEQLERCIFGMRKYDKEAPFIIYNDLYKSAAMFCQAARVDIEKDETLLMYKNLTSILENMRQNLFTNFREHKDFTESYFNKVKDDMKHQQHQVDRVHKGFQGVRTDFMNLRDDMRNVLNSVQAGGTNIEKAIKNIFQMAGQGIPDMLLYQEQAMELFTRQSMQQIEYLTESFSAQLHGFNQTLDLMLISVSDRQQSLDKMSEKFGDLEVLFDNMTESFQAQNKLIQDNNEDLKTTSELLNNINNSAMSDQRASYFFVILVLLGSYFWGGWERLVQAFSLCIAAAAITVLMNHGIAIVQNIIPATYALTSLLPRAHTSTLRLRNST